MRRVRGASCKRLHGQRRHQQHRAEQQRGDRRIAEDRQAADGGSRASTAPEPSSDKAELPLARRRLRVIARRRPSAPGPAVGAPRRAPAPTAPMPATAIADRQENANIGRGAARSDRARGTQLTVAEIAGQESQHGGGEHHAEQHAEERACDAERGTLAEERALQLAARHAQRAQQRRATGAGAARTSDCVENTKKAPVNSATSASMLRLTR